MKPQNVSDIQVKNIYKNFSMGKSIAVCKELAERQNETWFVIGDSGMVANAIGRRGYEQYEALAFHPDGTQEVIPANPKSQWLKVGDKVKPAGEPVSGGTYGYIRSSWIEERAKINLGKQICEVYWPEIKTIGNWPAEQLVKI